MDQFEAQNERFEADVRESFARLTLMKTMGAGLLRVAPGEVDIDLPFRQDLTQQHGFLAAAALTAIVDVACGYAAMTLMPAGSTVLTVEYKVNFLSPAQGQRMLAQARVVRPGRTVTTCAGDVFAVSGGQRKLVATMLATIMRVSAEREASSARDQDRAHRSGRLRADGRSERSRPWCVCRGGRMRRAMKEIWR